jgi:hypothetical protein
MNYRHPMPYFALVGGTHDGEIWDGAYGQILTMAKRTPLNLQSFMPLDLISKSQVEIETYTTRTIYVNMTPIIFYALATLTDMEALITLLKGYNPRGVRRKSK